ncbi:similar to Saccharomyces cerevisiae YCR020W-B HTL1 Component of the RSC chromatin remodeling complex [Maudiozyma barnettii]|uniref:Similar to Saccharomyces cerevisiae YCR020W-B HTL1 Component of the RSC chromatin remodeling complex n=1 Tax=Maudiozyma barnettii TaxID=61262 RepID=A0A8H2ZGK0_9SACH|nr:Htl1p [Kazachstania barnettii]CAB4254679.1 similar to Saccharomyces cerevisiae YCR020W-B HTL1 Component of the RSC chromatin remodeling complex [Kazachstania barnettii]CAD1782721.1 similar to Saccharomyces cerevisiae YCR020W-B HTL1 Component of the RSC chromatin remodeling complex [Kazachstania barnettii]
MSQRNDNITLKTATAYQLLAQRENMCELFNLIDRSELDTYFVNKDKKQETLKEMKDRLEKLKNEL